MPYEGEFAHYRPLQRIVTSERVQNLLGNYRIRGGDASHPSDLALWREAPPATAWAASWVLAVDGCHAEVRIRNGFPGAEAAYVTVASVLLDLEKTRSLDQSRPVDPQVFR